MARSLSILALTLAAFGPAAALAAPAAADDPSTLQVRQGIKVVFHATKDAWKKGTPKTLFYVDRPVHTAYPKKMGVPADRLDFKIVAHDAPVYWFLNDAARQTAKGKDPAAVPDHNPFKGLIQGLLDAGVAIEVCEVTMAQRGYTKAMLLPGIQTTPAGLPRVIDLMHQGFQRLPLQ